MRMRERLFFTPGIIICSARRKAVYLIFVSCQHVIMWLLCRFLSKTDPMESDAKPEQQVFDGISNFDKSALKSVKTEVKDTLPTKEGEKNNQSL